MFKNIIKRDGRIVPFDPEKITVAISKAGKATGEFDYDTAKRLTIKVLLLAEELIRDRDPHVEEIQDIVEEILLSSPYRKTAKAYIIYRDQHARMREIARQGGLELIDNYLSKVDWRISENSNMSFSLQGLNNYISSEISKSYWLHKIYPPEVREAHINGDMHIHDLNALSAYCVGWDLMDLLIRGFGGVPGKVESRPAKHLRPALGQIVNFLYTTQGECYSSDTQVLTYSGWKYFFELTEHDFIFTMNTETKKIELQKPVKFYEFDYNGAMYHFKSKKLDLLVTPNHRMLVQQYSPTSKENGKLKFIEAEKFNPNTHFIPKHALWKGRMEEYFILPEIKIYQYINFKKINSKSESLDILEEEAGIYSSQPIEKYEIKVLPPKKIPMNLWLKFFGFWLAEGCTYLRKRQRKGREVPYYEYLVRISQKKSEIAEEFEKVLTQIPFSYNKKFKADLIEFYINDKQLFSYLRKFGKSCDKFIPSEIKNLSKEQLEIIFDWLMKGDGWRGNGNIEYSTKSKKLADDIQEIALKLGMSANIYERKKGNFKWYDVGVFLAKNFRLNSVNKQVANYAGKVYCVEVPNHTLYVRRNGKACWCGNSAGAQAFSNVDTLLAPFIAYDGLNYKQVKQALQEWVFNLNVPTRVGFQTPFSNITLDLKVPEHFVSQAVIIGGKTQDATYGEFQREMDMFNQALFEVLSEGDAKGRVFTFPIPTINITKDFDWNSPVVDLIMQATAKYGIPYFANYVNSDLKPEDARSMCCRLRLETKALKHRGGGLFGSNPLTGSIGVVTIDLPRIGYLSNSEEEFYQRLLRLMEIAKTSLEIKRKVLERFTDSGLYPYSKHYLSSIKERAGAYWCNHFSTIGIIGMNEAIANARWLNSKGIWTEEGKAFALKVMDFMREKLLEYQKETGNLYNLEATPAEGTSYRLARIDKQKYPDIITQGSEHPYYTNSTWLPVGFTESIHYILDNQDELQSKYTGGTVQHIFLGEKPEPQKLKRFIRQVFEKYTLPYISITPTFSVCSECGYIEGEHSTCPKCGRECEIYSRVVGYLRPVSNWNEGKKEEFKDRKYMKEL
ncbi:ribonucleoside triphosphate reductase [Thermodesulfovibrio yellowstonii]|uniref:ribonucleoside triphosphate reductase n=1 Tax=Thermodesulfovibrio yellowstonii TaxID=28262 RepID=UPI0003F8C8D7|nr:ribonucleoside triphosphate reductase [Thermodesulfovibrio islandicus]